MTPRYNLRTLLILLAILPPLLAVGWWKYLAWREAERQRAERERMVEALVQLSSERGLVIIGTSPVPQPKAPAKAEE